jgi:hypothetical protein
VDKIAARHKRHFWVPLLLEGVFGDVLLHEIGHHIHATSAPEHSDKEEVADQWKKKLKDGPDLAATGVRIDLRLQQWFFQAFAIRE